MYDFSKLIPAADLSKRIAKIGKVGNALQTEIHEVAVQCLAHVAAHGDYTLAVNLISQLPSGQRRQALAAWNREFSGDQLTMSFDKQADAWKAKLVKGWDREKFRLEEAELITFGDFLPEKGYSTFDMKAFINLLKRKANEKGLNPNGSPKVEPAVRELCAAIYGRVVEATSKPKAEVIPLAALLVDEA